MELKATNISFKYPSAKEYLLKDINLELDNNKVMGLIGDSGSGKSTLCKILSGYVTKYEGSVTFDGNPLPKKGFKPVQLIYQHPEKVMNPKWKMDTVLKESWDVPDEFLEEFGIQKSWLTRFPQELSGGELQRFSVLRSLNPEKRNMGFLLVSHDMDLVDTICDDKIYLKDINGA